MSRTMDEADLGQDEDELDELDAGDALLQQHRDPESLGAGRQVVRVPATVFVIRLCAKDTPPSHNSSGWMQSTLCAVACLWNRQLAF